jgi:stage II sporulation protein D
MALPAAAVLATLWPAASAHAATDFYIRGGGDGHGIGMSQYGAYGYALHGAGYRVILAHYYRGTSLGTTNPDQTVRVLLATGAASFSGANSTGLKTAQTYTVRALSNGRLAILGPDNKRVGSSYAAPLTVTGPGALTVPGHGSFRGALQFRPDGQGGVETVNALGLDDYVQGVVAAEMPSAWAPQALDAQAVAARTYAITTTASGSGYDLYDDTRSQMYGGVGAETPATDAAVAATRGQVVTYAGRPAVTYFFASSGGYTESVQNVWPGTSPEPWLQGVADPYDGAGNDPYHQWSQQMSLRAAAAKLGSLVRGRLLGVSVTQHGVSPRILRAAVVGTAGSSSVSGGTLQQAFGLSTTYAAFTTITTDAAPSALVGSVYPARAGSTFWVQALSGGAWHTVGNKRRLGGGGTYRTGVPGPGHYRIQFNHFNGPGVGVSKLKTRLLRKAARRELAAMLALSRGRGPALPTGRLARYAWPLAGNRRPLRPVPLVLRTAGLNHRR